MEVGAGTPGRGREQGDGEMEFDLADINFVQKDIHALLSGRPDEHYMTLPMGTVPNPLVVSRSMAGGTWSSDQLRASIEGAGWWSTRQLPEGIEVVALRQLIAGGWVAFTGEGYCSIREAR